MTIIIYDRHIFIVQANGQRFQLKMCMCLSMIYKYNNNKTAKLIVENSTETTFRSSPVSFSVTSGIYYKSFMIIICDRNDSGQYYKTKITIVIYDLSLG